MRFLFGSLLGIGFALLLASCQPERVPLPPTPSVQPWRLQATPALRWLGQVFQNCAAKQPGASLLLDERTADHLDPQKADLVFQYGGGANSPPFAAVLGQDELSVITRPGAPLSAAQFDDLRAIYNGRITTWGAFNPSSCAQCALSADEPLKVYIYAEGDDARPAPAQWGVPGPNSLLAPDPQAVRQAVASDRNAVGFIPARWLDASVSSIKIRGGAPGGLSLPILAFGQAEPQGSLRSWLLCVQAALK